jgi:3-oxoacyl-[acyl-carrier protein] reductase
MSTKRRIAVVTGAANGTGEEYARKLAGQGVRVILADCDVRAGQQVAASLTSAELIACVVQVLVPPTLIL